MKTIDRILVGLLVAGVWSLIAIELTSITHAQETATTENDVQRNVSIVHANDVVGLSAFVQESIRSHQFRPQSMPGLDQYVRSIVRYCRVNGSVSGNRLTATSLSC